MFRARKTTASEKGSAPTSWCDLTVFHFKSLHTSNWYCFLQVFLTKDIVYSLQGSQILIFLIMKYEDCGPYTTPNIWKGRGLGRKLNCYLSKKSLCQKFFQILLYRHWKKKKKPVLPKRPYELVRMLYSTIETKSPGDNLGLIFTTNLVGY